MSDFVEKKYNTRNRVVNSFLENKKNSDSIATHIDNRKEGIVQEKFQMMADNSTQLKQLMSENPSLMRMEKAEDWEEEKLLQGKFDVMQRNENKTGLPDNLKTGMENISGKSLDHIKVHYNSSKPASVQAHAYAQGSEIHLASGQEKHLPHELGHVVQQMEGRVKPTGSVAGVAVNDNAELENEATQMGSRALQKMPAIAAKHTGVSFQKEAVRQCVRSKKASEDQQQYDADLAVYNKMLKKGRVYATALDDALAGSAEDKDTEAAYISRYNSKPKEHSSVPVNISGKTESPEDFISFDTTKKGEETGAYKNYVNAEEGRLIAGSNYAKDDPGPGRLSNSEILYHQYREGVEISRKGKPETEGISGLKEVIRSSIENKETQAVLRLCFTKVGDKFNEKSYEARTDNFYALLGTDNCKGVAFMLKDHRKEMQKSIKRIVSGGTGYLRIELEDYIAPKMSSPMGPQSSPDSDFNPEYTDLDLVF